MKTIASLVICFFLTLAALPVQAHGGAHGTGISGHGYAGKRHSHATIGGKPAAAKESASKLAGDEKQPARQSGSKVAGPNGGRLITSVKPNAEFLVTKDGGVQITFVDENGNAVAPQEQSVTLTTGSRSAPLTMAFSRQGDVLISGSALPAGDNHPAVLQIKTTPDAKTVTERFHINLAQCPTCAYAEYACICTGH